MADAAVEFLLGNLQQLLLYHTHLIKDAKDQVEKLENDLRLFKAFLKDSTKKRRKDEGLRELVQQIRDVVYEAEDIIDLFVTQAADIESKNYIIRAFKSPVNLHGIARQVEAIGGKVKEIYGDKSKFDFANLNLGDGGPEEPEDQAPIVRGVNVMGFEDEAETIIGYLREKKGQLDVISVVGMPGLGKTTLAEKIYRDVHIQYEFPTRIWVYVSQEFTKKDIYLAILREFTRITEDIQQKKEDELARMVYAYLEKGKFLIVMDDVWTAQDWDRIQVALPITNSTGKILLTSRNVDVACHANPLRDPHKLRFLTEAECWELLQYEVFGKPESPPELEHLGKLIANQCDRLPFAIAVIGGILVNKFSPSDDMSSKVTAWTKVLNSVKAYLSADPTRRMENIIALSYDKLPYHLRACFLYLGMFPEDYEIPVWKLTRLWIAEGFIQQKDGISLEEIAENYLDELINRNLVRVERRRPDGRVKTCRIHGMLRDFCKMEAGTDRENILQEIKKTAEGFHHLNEVQRCRRICLHSDVIPFVRSELFGPRVRSFVCFSKKDITLPPQNTSAITAAFKLLRVLDVKPIKFSKIPSDMYQLVHMRYITLSITVGILPAAFSKLWNLETLLVDTSCRTLDIKADIWKMNQLRHLKTNASATLPKAGKSGKEGEKLQTLGTISPQSCGEDVFDRARNLKKLGIRGRLASLVDGKTVSFNSLVKLGDLEKLKLLNYMFPSPASEGKLARLPPTYQFPPKLRSLTLSDTFLDWTHMSVLAMLEHLEVLKLKEKSFMGRFWESKDGGFRRLEVLHIGRTDLILWAASPHHYPRLKRLELHNCEDLKEVPICLADIPTFGELDLYRSDNASISAVNLHRAKKANGEFKLSIFPPIPR